MIILAGDIGGTNIRLALVHYTNARPRIITKFLACTRSVPSLEMAIEQFLANAQTAVDAAAFGVAAPITEGILRGPNLPWPIDPRKFADAARIPFVTLINDFTALGAGIPHLQPEDFHTLQPGNPHSTGTIAVIGAGTGLGQCYLTWNGQQYIVHPSEGGHSSFAPNDDRERQLSAYLSTRYGHVSYERILSGRGLESIYRYLIDVEQFPESQDVGVAMQSEDPAAVITKHATRSKDAACATTVALFAKVYGSQAGNFALTVLPTHGVYIAGGIAKHILPQLGDGSFISAFLAKGRMTSVLGEIPVHVILSEDVALLGAAAFAASVNPSSEAALPSTYS